MQSNSGQVAQVFAQQVISGSRIADTFVSEANNYWVLVKIDSQSLVKSLAAEIAKTPLSKELAKEPHTIANEIIQEVQSNWQK